MSSVQDLSEFYHLKTKKLSKEESRLLEAALFWSLCNELNHSTIIEDTDMSDENLVRCLINDLMNTGDYSLPGLACYTDTPEEVVHDIAAGINKRPSLFLARRVIELHKVARKEVYTKILDKILDKPNDPPVYT